MMLCDSAVENDIIFYYGVKNNLKFHYRVNKEAKIIFSIAGVLIIGMIILISMNPQGSRTPEVFDISSIVSSSSIMTGNIGAKVTIVEFGDYQCPACAASNKTIKDIIALYGDNPDFNFVYKHFPLPSHKHAIISAEATEAARAQGKFWEMHDMLYENQSEWSVSNNPSDIFIEYADRLNLDTDIFQNALKNHTYRSIVQADAKDGDSVDVRWTPTFYINGKLLEQTPTFIQFQSIIDTLLEE
jgi:protein-disulfide isomerase